MKQKFYTSSLVFLVMLSTCILAGCSDDKKSNPTEDNGKKSHSAAVDMSSWPDDLPKFKDGKLITILNNKDTGVLDGAVFSQIKNPETAYTNYKTALKNAGWAFDVDTSSEFAWGAAYEKGTKGTVMIIQKDGSTAQIFYLID